MNGGKPLTMTTACQSRRKPTSAATTERSADAAHARRLALAEVPPDLARRLGHDGGVQVVDRARTRQLHGEIRDHASGPRRHHDDPVGDEDRLGDAVRDQQDRRRRAFPEPQQLQVEPLAAQRVEGAERLVEQQHLGLERERAGEGDPLARPAGQLGGPVPAHAGVERTSSVELGQSLERRAGGQPASSSG